MTKLVIALAASLLTLAPAAWADESETHIEESVEQHDGFDSRSAQRSVDIERESDEGSRTVEREETIEADDGEVERHVEEQVEHGDDD